MRIRSRVVFHLEQSKAKEMLSPLGFKIRDDTMQVVKIFNDTKKYKKLIKMLTILNINYTEFYEEVYSKGELDSAEILCMIPKSYCGYPQPEDEYEEFSYDKESACPSCSQGMRQINPIRMNKPKIGMNDISALHRIFEFIITRKLLNMMQKENFTGYEIWPVINHRKNIERDDVFQLMITGKMPPMSSAANIIRTETINPNYSCSSKK